MVVELGLSVLVIVFFLFFVALIPGAIIYFDARRKGRNKYFWSLSVVVGLLMGFIPGLMVILVYLLKSDYSVALKEANQSAGENEHNGKADLSDSELERVLGILNENERKIVEVLSTTNDMSQKEIAAKTGLSTPTVSRILNKLESKGIVMRYRDGMSKRVRLNKDLFPH